jgi:hypothetical protein
MPKKDSNFAKRREAIMRYMELAGAFTLPLTMQKDYAEKWGVSDRQIRRDVKEILKKLPIPDVIQEANKILLSYKQTFSDAITVRNNQDPEIKSKGVNDFIKCVSAYGEFLDNFGFKKPIPQQYQVEGMSTPFLLIETPVEVIKNEKLAANSDSGKTESEPKTDGNPESP